MPQPTSRDILSLKTPHGHEVTAELDYENYAVCGARVIHTHTGIIRPLGNEITENLSRALHAKKVYEHALEESRAVQDALGRFGDSVMALGKQHPALQPYWREMEQHETIARDMHARAQQFHQEAMKAIDRLIED